MNIVVTGGRDYFPTQDELMTFLDVFNTNDNPVLLHGCASGVDSVCAGLVGYRGYEVRKFPANWKPNGRFDPGAGAIRNALMIQEADMLIAFKGGRGTQNCIDCAKRKGIPIKEIGRD